MHDARVNQEAHGFLQSYLELLRNCEREIDDGPGEETRRPDAPVALEAEQAA